MTLFRANRRTLYFAHIPKTGGTSVAVTIRRSGAKQAMHFRRRIGGLGCPPQHLHDELFSALIPPAFYDASMAVVRNPYDRMASEYRYRRDLERLVGSFDTWAAASLAEFEHNRFVLDNHIRPQVAFVRNKMKIFRFEDGIDQAIDHGCEALQIPAAPTEHLKKGPSARIGATSATIALIREFYAEDFERFGYDPDDVPAQLQG